MIVIKNIEYLDVEGDTTTIMHCRPHDFVPLAEGSAAIQAEALQQEVVRGRRFVRPNGQEVVVGMSQAAQDVIGLQYEAWGSLEKDRDYWHTRYVAARLKIDSIKKAGFWQRLKYLFGRA